MSRVRHLPQPARRAGQVLVLAAWLALAAGPAGAIQLIDPPSEPARAARIQLALESFRLLEAYPDRTFQGERAITRYELADALGRALSYLQQRKAIQLDEDPRLGMVFEAYLKPTGDIPGRIWAAPALLRVLGYGLMGGTRDMRFQGGNRVSREELAISLSKLLDWLQVTPVAVDQRQAMDSSADPAVAEAVQKLVQSGILELDGAGRFSGFRPANRYDLAESLVRLLQQVDLVAQQRPLQPKKVLPQVLPKTPAGRVQTRYHRLEPAQ